MSGGSGRVLLIEDNRAQARLIREQLSDVKTGSFEMDLADRLSEGLSQLENGDFAGVLLDLSLPDSQGLETAIREVREFRNFWTTLLSSQRPMSTTPPRQ